MSEPPPRGWSETGVASWYGEPFHGRLTASGQRYDMEAMTAAHRTLPFGSVIEVRNLDNGRETRVEITDRGPFARGRILDLSRAAARAVDMLGPGTARVRITVLEPGVPRGAFRGCEVVQLGAFRSAGNARAKADEVLAAGFPAYVRRDEDGLSRAWAGPFTDASGLESLLDRFEGLRRPCDAARVESV